MTIKAVLFDVDNTLVDFMRMKQIAVETAIDYMMSAGLPGLKEELYNEIFAYYRSNHIESQKALEVVIEKRLGSVDRKILAMGIIGYQRGRDMSTYAYPKVEITIKEIIRMGLQVGVVSDAPSEQCYNRLARLHLIPWLDVVVTYDDTHEYKPSEKPFRLALDRLGLGPDETLYVGDWPQKDIVGSKKVGLVTVFARWGEHKNAPDTGADYDLDSVEKILGVIRDINSRVNI